MRRDVADLHGVGGGRRGTGSAGGRGTRGRGGSRAGCTRGAGRRGRGVEVAARGGQQGGGRDGGDSLQGTSQLHVLSNVLTMRSGPEPAVQRPPRPLAGARKLGVDAGDPHALFRGAECTAITIWSRRRSVARTSSCPRNPGSAGRNTSVTGLRGVLRCVDITVFRPCGTPRLSR